jgi:hypothetical protein
MNFSSKPMAGYKPYQFFPEASGAGLPETAADAEVASWPDVPAMAHRPGTVGPMGFGRPTVDDSAKPQLAFNDIFPGLPANPFQPMDPDEAMRQLRMERARQSYERNFGMHHADGASMASQGNQASIDFLLERIKRARAEGAYQSGDYKRRM